MSTIEDQDGATVDLSSATLIRFIFEKPDGTLLTVNGEKATDGTDGKVKYVVQAGDLSQVGLWRYQTLITLPFAELYSNISKFKVLGNLPI
jgi:hypothetical protein